ncbi:MAG: hypothetical protein LBL58_13535 [Tannerellaceae bacterium]|jgi:hypothetical protein|nr:hypothetical protein [Tannerellaceae bacterium]
MRKIALIHCLLAITAITMSLFAQSEKRNSFGIDIGLNTPTQPFNLGISLDLRYLHDFNSKFGWDILDIRAGVPFKGFGDVIKKPGQIGMLIMTGPRVYMPIDEKTRMFFSLKGGYSTCVTFDNVSGLCIEPQIGIRLTKELSFSIAYNHSWTSVTNTWSEQVTERYVTGSHQVYLTSTHSYITVNDYGTRSITRENSITTDSSGGSFCLKLGFDF